MRLLFPEASMRSKTAAPNDYLPLRPSIYRVLLALGDQEMHGYAIIQSFLEQTEGRERILPGTLYASLARMVEDGMVEERDQPEGDTSGGPPRRYYRRTPLGRAVARAESERLRALLEIAVAQKILPRIVR
jgi:DNA-binding PadR family transcriptional regulator